MAEDGEWHTVTNNKGATTVAPPPPPPQPSKARRKSRHKITTKQASSKQPTKEKSVSTHKEHNKSVGSTKETTKSVNPFHAAEEDDSDEEEEDGQVDPIDLPVPPYHTSIIISCPLEGCESPIPFMDTTSLVKHLKEDHHLLFKNLHHMYMALDSYLNRWAKEFEKKPISEYAQPDSENSNGKKKELLYAKDPC